jgi:hypothetical protein
VESYRFFSTLQELTESMTSNDCSIFILGSGKLFIWFIVQVPPVYQDLEPRSYEELEARVEEAIRDALYGASSGQVCVKAG